MESIEGHFESPISAHRKAGSLNVFVNDDRLDNFSFFFIFYFLGVLHNFSSIPFDFFCVRFVKKKREMLSNGRETKPKINL